MVTETLTTVNFFAPVQDLLQKVEERMRSQADPYHPDLRLAMDHLLSAGGDAGDEQRPARPRLPDVRREEARRNGR